VKVFEDEHRLMERCDSNYCIDKAVMKLPAVFGRGYLVQLVLRSHQYAREKTPHLPPRRRASRAAASRPGLA
jgi:hypothetical protein